MSKNPLTSTLVDTNAPFRPLRRRGDHSLMGSRMPYPGMDRVVDLARELIEHYRGEEFVREKALRVTRNIDRNPRTDHPDMRNYDAIAIAIHDWIVANIRYVRDQNAIERIQTPDATMQLQTGDCDDMVILAGSLLESVGVPTRIKLIGSQPGDRFSHIYLEYHTDDRWKSFDPTLAMYPGFEIPKTNIRSEKTIEIRRPQLGIQPAEAARGSAFVFN